jgi:hypothetical protein
LWRRLSRTERDLIFLRTVSWLVSIQWFKPSLPQGIVAVGAVGSLVELFQGDAVGVVMAAGLTAIAGLQVWRNVRGTRIELEADEAAVKTALRRGYTEADAAQGLLSAIEAIAELENRPQLTFAELVRCQNLRAIAGLSPVGTPATIRDEEGLRF